MLNQRPDAKPTGPLPLRLEPFEEYMLRDQRVGYSMVFPYTLYFRGTIDRTVFEQALAQALQHEPLLTAKVCRRWLKLVWTPTNESLAIEWNDGSDDADDTAGSVPVPIIDLWSEAGLKVVVTISGEVVRILFGFHHACSDGVGANRFISEVMAHYGRMIGDPDGLDDPPPCSDNLSERGQLDITLPEPLTFFQQTTSIIKETFSWLLKRPKPLFAHGNTEQIQEQTVIWKRVDENVLTGLRAVAHAANVSLNDVLIRDLFLTCHRWNLEGGHSKPKDLLQILVPVNMRKTRHRNMPSANIMGYSFLIRSMDRCSNTDSAELLSGISQEMKFVRDWSLAALFLFGLGMVRLIPGALRLLTSKHICHATCVLSSIMPVHAMFTQKRFRKSKTIEVGELTLERLIAAPPVRPFTRASFCATLLDSELFISGAFEQSCMTPADSQKFLEEFFAQLQRTAQALPAPTDLRTAELNTL
ncbi:MAG: hypothetical protein SGJ20_15865 [Planctomycetota bacterium]|nr:hypothetical protein [Planctomycetota bacterium]